MNVVESLLAQARERPNAIALAEGLPGRRSLTFARLDDASARAAALLEALGLAPGDRVLVLQPMSIDLYVALVAFFRLGLVATFLDPSAGCAHIERCCAICPPSAFLGSAKAHLLRLVSPALRRIPVRFGLGPCVPGALNWSTVEQCARRRELFDATADTPALLTFTSGSTGEPKAAVRTHGLLLAQHRALEESIGFPPGAVDLCAMPIVVLANLGAGVTTVIPAGDLRRPAAVDPGPILAQAEAWPATRAVGSPAFFERLAAVGRPLPALREVFTGGAPVLPGALAAIARLAPNARVTAVYGSTEAEPIAHLAADEIGAGDLAAMAQGMGLPAGPPVSAVRLAVLPDRWGAPLAPMTAAELDALRLPAGEIGEIAVAGDHVLPGYLDGRGDAETKFRVDGEPWHRTGDAGYLDAHGRLWLMGRCSARAADDRGVLYPFAVEVAAAGLPGVRRAALVAHAGKRLLAVEPDPGARHDPADLGSRLAWARLDEVRLVRRIPVDRRHNAKADYPALRRALRLR